MPVPGVGNENEIRFHEDLNLTMAPVMSWPPSCVGNRTFYDATVVFTKNFHHLQTRHDGIPATKFAAVTVDVGELHDECENGGDRFRRLLIFQ